MLLRRYENRRNKTETVAENATVSLANEENKPEKEPKKKKSKVNQE